ncbi:hypothetical protein Tco_1435702, partial [Tanacetum coccineum]
EYVSPASLEVVRPWFEMIGYNEEIVAQGTLKKSCLPPRWRLTLAQIIHYLGALKPNQPEGPLFTDHMKAICNIDVPIDFQAPKTSSQIEKTEASKSKTVQSDKETQSSLAKDKIPSHPSPSTPVVGEMHKWAQQAAGGPTSLGFFHFHSESVSGCDASADSTAKVDPVKSDPNDSIPSQQGMDEGTKNYSIDHIFAGTNLSVLVYMTKSAFLTPDSPQDEPIIVLDESEEEEIERYEDTHTTYHDGPEGTSIPHPPSPKSVQIQELMAQLTELLVTSLKPELSKLLASHDFASCLPTELKELPLNINGLSGDVQELKKHVRNMEIEIPRDLKEILTKLETFTSTISSLTSQVVELNNIQWELPTEFLDLPRFSSVVKNASGATGASPAEGEKKTYPATKEANLKNDLVDLMGIDVVEKYHKKKLLYDKYYDKMLKRKKSPNIINCDVLTKKGPITLKVYREDRMDEVISNFKVNDLHLAE